MDELQRRVLQFIRRHRLLQDGQGVVVGFSGGPDSVALVLILLGLSEEGKLPLTVHLAHLNHGLRGAESDEDEEFCREFARKHGLDLEVEKAAIAAPRRHGTSLEAAAREIRYDFLGRAAKKKAAAAVATAHHADDVAETVLLRLIRGAALAGLGGLAPERPLRKGDASIRLVRPLLEVRKAELLGFLQATGQDSRADSSNLDTDYTRNKIRHSLIPTLEREFPTFSVGSLCALNESAIEAARLFEELLDGLWEGLCTGESTEDVTFDAEAYARAPTALRKAAAARALEVLAAGGRAPGLRAQHYGDLAALPHRDVGTEVSLPGGFFARHEHGLVYFSRHRAATPVGMKELPVPGAVELPEIGMRISCEALPPGVVGPEQAAQQASSYEVYLDLEAVAAPLKVRSRRPGDTFHALGCPGSCRLKKFLIGQKVPRHKRDTIPLVTASDGRIAWVVGYRIGEQFKLRSADRPALRLRADGLPGPERR